VTYLCCNECGRLFGVGGDHVDDVRRTWELWEEHWGIEHGERPGRCTQRYSWFTSGETDLKSFWDPGSDVGDSATVVSRGTLGE
jgi:hypothetical protein